MLRHNCTLAHSSRISLHRRRAVTVNASKISLIYSINCIFTMYAKHTAHACIHTHNECLSVCVICLCVCARLYRLSLHDSEGKRICRFFHGESFGLFVIIKICDGHTHTHKSMHPVHKFYVCHWHKCNTINHIYNRPNNAHYNQTICLATQTLWRDTESRKPSATYV